MYYYWKSIDLLFLFFMRDINFIDVVFEPKKSQHVFMVSFK